MKRKALQVFVLFAFIFADTVLYGSTGKYSVKSPDGRIEVKLTTEKKLSLLIILDGKQVVECPELSMSLEDGSAFGISPQITEASVKNHKGVIDAPFYRQNRVADNYSELIIKTKDDYGLKLRVYDDGVAYRFYSTGKKPYSVTSETSQFNFKSDYNCYVPYSASLKDPFATSFESKYKITPISGFEANRLAFLPLLIDLKDGKKIVITESDLESYPGMFLKGTTDGKSYGFKGVFAPRASEKNISQKRGQENIVKYSGVLAKCKGEREFPWRIVTFSDQDKQLPVNDMVYRLASPSRLSDISWIKPGKVAWDWWNNWGLTDVNFPVGINTQTYKYYIDFAAANGLEYVVLDEGWSPPSGHDIMKPIDQIDLKELISYASGKDVKLILWCVAYVLDKNLEEACRYYSGLGFAGFKVDFLNRDDQEAVDLVYRIADMCAKYKLIVDYHGMYKPTGLNRTYPNVLNNEGIWGLEQMKWSTEDMVEYDVTFPYIRMLAGPVDYTQGAMKNSTREDFKPVYNSPMSQGTRSRQVAEYIVFDGALSMLCDSPTAYIKEPETTGFIAGIPVVFDKTFILDGEIGKYIVTARVRNGEWYIGGLTNWDSRELKIDLSMLEKGVNYSAEIFCDGEESAAIPTRYRLVKEKLNSKSVLKIKMAPGGGFAIKLKR